MTHPCETRKMPQGPETFAVCLFAQTIACSERFSILLELLSPTVLQSDRSLINFACQAGAITSSRGSHELDQRYLDQFHEAVGAREWPEQWRWEPGSDPADRPGVKVDEDGRVVSLELDFREREGEPRCGHGLGEFGKQLDAKQKVIRSIDTTV